MRKNANDHNRKMTPKLTPVREVKAMTNKLVKMRQELTDLAYLCDNHLLWVEDRLNDVKKKSPSKNLIWRINNTISLLQMVMADAMRQAGRAGPSKA